MSAEIKIEIRIARTRQKNYKTHENYENLNFLIIFQKKKMVTIARKVIIKKLFVVTFKFDFYN